MKFVVYKYMYLHFTMSGWLAWIFSLQIPFFTMFTMFILGFTLTVVIFFADFSVNSHPIIMKFYKYYFLAMGWLLWKCHLKILYSLKVNIFNM